MNPRLRDPGRSAARESRGIILAIVLVLIFALITAVFTFQRRAIIDATISFNRIDAAEADALAKGGLRIAEVIVTVVRAKHLGGGAGGGPPTGGGTPALPSGQGSGGAANTGMIDQLWENLARFPIELEGDRRLQISIEDEGAKLNLNALVEPTPPATSNEDDGQSSEPSEEAVEYLAAVMEHVIDGMQQDADGRNYDPEALAENLLDYIDADSTAINGRGENDYYRRQEPPYTPPNRPFASFDEISLVEGVDPPLLEAMRPYFTVHPIAAVNGINLNRAEPWVLALVYTGTSGNMRLLAEDDAGQMVKDILDLRSKGKIVCSDAGSDPRCIPLSDVGNGDLASGTIYPAATLPAKPAVFRVVATAQVRNVSRSFEVIYDTRTNPGPQLLSWRRLRGNE